MAVHLVQSPRGRPWSLTALAGILAMAVAGCGSDSGSRSASGGAKKDAKDVKIAFVAAASSQNFSQEMAAGAKAAGAELDVNVKILAPPAPDEPAQVKLFQDATHTARDGIAVQPLVGNLFVRPMANAIRSGTPVIAVDTAPAPDSDVETYVGNDNLAAGAMLARAAIERLPRAAAGSVVVGDPVPGLPLLRSRADGIRREFERKRKGLTLEGPLDTKVVPTENFAAWNSLVRSHPDAVAFLGVGDQDSVSLARIKRATAGRYLTGAFDLNPAALNAVADRVNFALVDPQHFLKGYIATRLLIERATSDKPLPKGWWNPGAALVTSSNVQKIIARQRDDASKLEGFKATIARQFADPQKQIQPLDRAR